MKILTDFLNKNNIPFEIQNDGRNLALTLKEPYLDDVEEKVVKHCEEYGIEYKFWITDSSDDNPIHSYSFSKMITLNKSLGESWDEAGVFDVRIRPLKTPAKKKNWWNKFIMTQKPKDIDYDEDTLRLSGIVIQEEESMTLDELVIVEKAREILNSHPSEARLYE